MSDFIKVNLLKQESYATTTLIVNKLNITLCHFVYSEDPELFAVEFTSKPGVTRPITREEYDRLCKELGVDNPGQEMRIKDLEYSNKCLRHDRDEAQRKYHELIHQQKCRDAERARKELGIE